MMRPPNKVTSCRQSWLLYLFTVGLMGVSFCGCATVKPALPTGADFDLPKADLYNKYPELQKYDQSAQLLVRQGFIDVPYVSEIWGEPDRSAMSLWNLFPPQIAFKPAFWHYWKKGRYNVGLYYERPLVCGWQPLGIRLDFQDVNNESQ